MTQICLESLHGAQHFKHNHCKHHDFLSCSSNLGNLGTLQEKCSGSLRIENNTVQGDAKLNWISSFLGSSLVWKNQHKAAYAKLTSWWLRPIWTIGSFPQIGNMKNISNRHPIMLKVPNEWKCSTPVGMHKAISRNLLNISTGGWSHLQKNLRKSNRIILSSFPPPPKKKIDP